MHNACISVNAVNVILWPASCSAFSIHGFLKGVELQR